MNEFRIPDFLKKNSEQPTPSTLQNESYTPGNEPVIKEVQKNEAVARDDTPPAIDIVRNDTPVSDVSKNDTVSNVPGYNPAAVDLSKNDTIPVNEPVATDVSKKDNMFVPALQPAPKTDGNEQMKKDRSVLSESGNIINSRFDDINEKVLFITNMIHNSGENKCSKIKDADTLLNNIKSLVIEIKDVMISFNEFTFKHLDYIKKYYKADVVNTSLLNVSLNKKDNNYPDRVASFISMSNHFVSLASLVFKCSDSWFSDQEMSMETKRNIYTFLDYFQHHISYIITLELYFKKYSINPDMNNVINWNKESETRKRQTDKYLLMLSPKKSNNACVIS